MRIRVSISVEDDLFEIIMFLNRFVRLNPAFAMKELKVLINMVMESKMPTDGGGGPIQRIFDDNVKMDVLPYSATDLDIVVDNTLETLDSHNKLNDCQYTEARAMIWSFLERVETYLVSCIVPITLKEIRSFELEWVGATIIGAIDV